MKRALLVGVDKYSLFPPLRGCVNDVKALEPLLARNAGGSPNFACRSLRTDRDSVDRGKLLDGVEALLGPGADVALLYFAGHGTERDDDVVLTVQTGTATDPGVALAEVLGVVRRSKVGEIIIILDCCFSGGAGGVPQIGGNVAVLREGLSLLTASRGDQTAAETAERGAFSTWLCSALDGGAADVLGRVTLAGVYSYISESFGPWDQRPTFKANLDKLHELRRCDPSVPVEELRRLPELFRTPDTDFPLDPSYEPTMDPTHPQNEAIFKVLLRFRDTKLLRPVDAEHMYYAAVESKSCRLTPLGRHYWKMASEGWI